MAACFAAMVLVGPALSQAPPIDVSRQVGNSVGQQGARVQTGQIEGQIADRIVRPVLAVRRELRASAIAVSANGAFAAIAFAGGGVALWDFERGREVVRFKLPQDAVAVAAADNGLRAAAALRDGSLYILDKDGGRKIGKAGPLISMAASADFRELAAARKEGGVVAFSSNGVQRQAFGTARLLAVGYDGATIIALSSDGRVGTERGGEGATWAGSGGSQLRSGTIAASGALAVDSAGRIIEVSRSGVAKSLSAITGLQAIAGDNRATAALALDEAGRASVVDTATGALLARILSTAAGWAVMDARGRYDGSRLGLAEVQWQIDNQATPIEAFADRYFEPGVLGRQWTRREILGPQPPAIEEGVLRPPVVELVLPEGLKKVGGEPYQALVIATSRGAPVSGVRFYHNGRALPSQALVQTQDAKTKDGADLKAASFLLTPTPGLNSFRAMAETEAGFDVLSERVVTQFTGNEYRGVLRALVVGIDDYSGALPALSYAVADADAVAARFQSSPSHLFASVEVVVVRNGEASRAAILSKLDAIANAAKPEDTILVYLAGHAVSTTHGDWVFGAHRIRTHSDSQLEATGLSAKDLEARLNASSARSIALMIDACFAGASARAFAEHRRTFQRALNDLSRRSGFAILAGAREDANAQEAKTLGHGAFTYAVLQGLNGAADDAPKDQLVTMGELISYVEGELPRLSISNNLSHQEARAYVLGADFVLGESR